ncbi:MAG: biotin/lipoyl-binding protein, partial [Planctomycetales bacterium]
VDDLSMEPTEPKAQRADSDDPTHVGANMPGMVVAVAIKNGDAVSKGQKLLSLEAMKMESTVTAERDGQIAHVLVKPGSQVETGDLLLRYESLE